MNAWLVAAAVLLLMVGGAMADDTDTWVSDTSIVSGLTDVGTESTPNVFQMNGTWYLLSGSEYNDVFGFNWTGSAWQSDSAIASGIVTGDTLTAPNAFQMNSAWYVIVGTHANPDFLGFNWNGSAWQSDSAILSGIADDPDNTFRPMVFQKDGTWYFIAGKAVGTFIGYNWTGSAWQSDSAIISGLGDIGSYATPAVWQEEGTWYLITGEQYGHFKGFNWTGSAWQSDSNIVTGLPDVGYVGTPTVFQKDGIWYLITGNHDGVFYGFRSDIPFPPKNLIHTIGKYWVNHTWESGGGDPSMDSYNVSINETWYNDTTDEFYNNTLSTYGDWSNITVYTFNNTYGLSGGNVSEDVQLPLPIPAAPVGAGSTWDFYWVNHTWAEGICYGLWCGISDSYNVSINETWYNGTTDEFYNNTLPPHGWSNASIYAYNSTAGINETYIYQTVQMVNRNITITNGSDWNDWEGVTVYIDYDATDPDSDTPTFSCNRTDLFTDFDVATGTGNWTPPNSGTWYVDFGVSDGWGSIDNYTMTIVSNVATPANVTNLTNTTGWYWVNYTWEEGEGGSPAESYNVSINGTWHNGTTDTYYNNTGLIDWGQWSNITVLAYTDSTGKLSAGNVSDNVRLMPTLTPYNNFTNNNLQAFSSFEHDFTVKFSCSSNVNVKTWTWHNVDSSSGTSNTIETNATTYIDSWGTGTVTVIAASDYGEINTTWTYDIIPPDDWVDPNYAQSSPISIYSGCDDVFHYYVKIEHVDTTGCMLADCSDLFFCDPRWGRYSTTLPFYTTHTDGHVHRTTDETVYVRMQWLMDGAQMIYMYSGCAASSKLRDNQFGGYAILPSTIEKEFYCTPPCDDSEDLYVNSNTVGVTASLRTRVNESGSCSIKYLSGNIGDGVAWGCSEICGSGDLYMYPTRRYAGTACSAYDTDLVLIQPYGGASVGISINGRQFLWQSGNDCWVNIGGHNTHIAESGTVTDSFSIDPTYNGGFATRAGVYSHWGMSDAGGASIYSLYYGISQYPNPCGVVAFFGEDIYEPVPVIATYDTQGNNVYGLNYMIYDKDNDEIYRAWTQDPDGIVYLNDPIDRNIIFVARTCDGQFTRDFSLTHDIVVNMTIPTSYNLDIYAYDKDTGVGLKSTTCSLSEYSVTNPRFLWGSDYASAMFIPLKNCTSAPYCDIMVQRWGYESYNGTKIDWTAKSTMIRDYRHNVLLTK